MLDFGDRKRLRNSLLHCRVFCGRSKNRICWSITPTSPVHFNHDNESQCFWGTVQGGRRHQLPPPPPPHTYLFSSAPKMFSLRNSSQLLVSFYSSKKPLKLMHTHLFACTFVLLKNGHASKLYLARKYFPLRWSTTGLTPLLPWIWYLSSYTDRMVRRLLQQPELVQLVMWNCSTL